MKIAFVGCGYVFDIYMRTRWAHPELDIRGVFDIDDRRAATVRDHYRLRLYTSLDDLLADPDVEAVVNLTSIGAHFEVTRRALEAGKHVYSEKPLTNSFEQTRDLFKRAAASGLVLTGAPSNLFSDSIFTLRQAVARGAVGKPVLALAELDDNPAHLMRMESVRSPTGAPFPYAEEFQEGCTIEHLAYHLVWLCAIFGPVQHVTAFADCLVPAKTATPLSPPDTPDFSVACLQFANGVAARVTCSWVAPRDHSFRIVGDQGQVSVDNIFHDQSPVQIERFSRLSLSARKSRSLRAYPFLGSLFGIGGRRLRLERQWKSHAVESERGVGRSAKHRLVSWLRRREVYAQDKLLGPAEMARALREGSAQPLSPDFLLHVNELTLLVGGAGKRGLTAAPTTTFAPMPLERSVTAGRDQYRRATRPSLLERTLEGLVGSLHR